jgi:(2Fe-2S) ferredoxin
MSAASRRAAPPGRCAVTICHGCCCGTLDKHAEVDSAGHRDRLLRLADQLPEMLRVQVSDCLDVCERSNVLVVRPSPAGRRRGARPVWLGGLLADVQLEAVTAWLRDGGPGVSDPPAVLRPLVFTPRPDVPR